MTQYIRHSVAPLSIIVDAIIAGWNLPEPKMTYEGLAFNIYSLRLKTMCRAANRNELHCSACKLPAIFFAVESFSAKSDKISYHVNLYGVKDKKEILFTHDHTLARSLGGKNDLSNTTVMCSPCNSKKSLWENDEVMRRKRYKKEMQ